MHPSIQKNYIELTMEGMLELVAFYHCGGLNGKPSDSYAIGYTLYTYLKNMGEITGIDERLKWNQYWRFTKKGDVFNFKNIKA